jgi:hypothetical protein
MGLLMVKWLLVSWLIWMLVVNGVLNLLKELISS